MAKDSAARQSNMLGEEQFRWNRDQAKKAEQEAARQRAEEALRKGRITDAVSRLNAMFDGGKYTSAKITDPQEGMNYFDASGNAVTYRAPTYKDVYFDPFGREVPMAGGDFQGFPGGRTERRLITPGTKGDLYTSASGAKTQKYEGFTEDFYKKRADDFFQHYKPQIEDQFGQANTTMKYGMGDAGILNSSVANTDAAKLARDKILRTGEVQSKGQQIAGDLRSRVNQVRSNLLSQVQVANDPSELMQSASSQLNSLRADPIQYDPIGDIFGAGARAYGSYQNGQRAASYGGGGGVSGGGISKGTGIRF